MYPQIPTSKESKSTFSGHFSMISQLFGGSLHLKQKTKTSQKLLMLAFLRKPPHSSLDFKKNSHFFGIFSPLCVYSFTKLHQSNNVITAIVVVVIMIIKIELSTLILHN